jgi:hypothetical protein
MCALRGVRPVEKCVVTLKLCSLPPVSFIRYQGNGGAAAEVFGSAQSPNWDRDRGSESLLPSVHPPSNAAAARCQESCVVISDRHCSRRESLLPVCAQSLAARKAFDIVRCPADRLIDLSLCCVQPAIILVFVASGYIWVATAVGVGAQNRFCHSTRQGYCAQTQAGPGNDINVGSPGFQQARTRGAANLVAIWALASRSRRRRRCDHWA